MEENEALMKKRFSELSLRAEKRGCAEYTEFLDLAQQQILFSMKLPSELFGGYPGAERVVARFGEGGEWPIVCVKASPVSRKFAEPLAHRDCLGALMALGIKRSVLGDIVLSDETAYILCDRELAPYLAEQLTEIRNTSVSCELLSEMPEVVLPQPEKKTVIVSSDRLDALVAAVWKLSRGEAQELFPKGKVFLNAREISKPDLRPEEGTIISVRGYGRFRYCGAPRETKKGRLCAEIEIW